MPQKISLGNANFGALVDHIRHSASLGLPFVEKDRHAGEPGAVIVGCGPSLQNKTVLRQLRAYADRGHTFIGIKEALTWLRDRDLPVHYGVNMDPGAQEVERTPVVEGVVYCVASSCHPALFRHILDGGVRVQVFHSACGAAALDAKPGICLDVSPDQQAIILSEAELKTTDGLLFSPVCYVRTGEIDLYRETFGEGRSACMNGGYTVANRALSLAWYMGFRDIALAGCDFGFREDSYYAGFVAAKPADETFASDGGKIDGRPWRTRPDLLASAVDIARHIVDGNVTVVGDSLAASLAGYPLRPDEAADFRRKLAGRRNAPVESLAHLSDRDVFLTWICSEE